MRPPQYRNGSSLSTDPQRMLRTASRNASLAPLSSYPMSKQLAGGDESGQSPGHCRSAYCEHREVSEDDGITVTE
jgi:hypothetical protein